MRVTRSRHRVQGCAHLGQPSRRSLRIAIFRVWEEMRVALCALLVALSAADDGGDKGYAMCGGFVKPSLHFPANVGYVFCATVCNGCSWPSGKPPPSTHFPTLSRQIRPPFIPPPPAPHTMSMPAMYLVGHHPSSPIALRMQAPSLMCPLASGRHTCAGYGMQDAI